jgi:8-oxo-dGTP diphosphatase
MSSQIVLCVFYRLGSEIQVWTQLRKTKDRLYSKIEFPGGKIENHETPQIAIKREVLEEVGVHLESPILLSQFYDSEQELYFHLFIHPELENLDHEGWIGLKKLKTDEELREKIPPMNHRFIDVLVRYLYDNEYVGLN